MEREEALATLQAAFPERDCSAWEDQDGEGLWFSIGKPSPSLRVATAERVRAVIEFYLRNGEHERQ